MAKVGIYSGHFGYLSFCMKCCHFLESLDATARTYSSKTSHLRTELVFLYHLLYIVHNVISANPAIQPPKHNL